MRRIFKLSISSGLALACAFAVSSHSAMAINGGSFAKDGQFPSILSLSKKSEGVYCGATLISSLGAGKVRAVTAAHCATDEDVEEGIEVRGGNIDATVGKAVKVESAIRHGSLDLAVVSLTGVPEGAVPTVLETDEYSNLPGEKVALAGWGKTEEGAYSPKRLKYVNSVIHLPAKCGQPIGPFVCMKGAEGFADYGDSGGPIFGENGNLAGVFVESDENDGSMVGVFLVPQLDWISKSE